jgi:hypothetical protein
MNEYEFLDNAFWESEDKTSLKCIRLVKLGDNKGKKKEVLSLRNKLEDGSDCPTFKEVVAKFGVARIDQHTEERKDRKEKEERERRAVHEQRKKSAELEMLFNMKLQAFEIEEIKNAKDRDLRAKLRRAKNVVELNALAAIVIGNELGYFRKTVNESAD